MKLCKDCKFFSEEKRPFAELHWCSHPKLVDPVTGENASQCSEQRGADFPEWLFFGKCGKIGRYFKAR